MDYLAHYGRGHLDGGHSGRYPYGSGENPYQHSKDFLNKIDKWQKEGKTEKEIAELLHMSTTKLRITKSIAKDIRTQELRTQALKMREEGKSLNEIAAKLGFENDSSVRNLLSDKTAARLNKKDNIAEDLKKAVDEYGIIDVGKGVEYNLNITSTRLDKAVEMLKAQGYEVRGGRLPQINNPGKYTTWKVVAKPGTEHSYIYEHLEKMQTPDGVVNPLENLISRDGGETLEKKFVYPASMDSKRLMIRYRDDDHPELSGLPKDGVMEIRRGVKDLDLGESHYAQVRILVDGDRYLKGMAIYGKDEDFPKGVDVIFNTNKTPDVPKRDVLKKIESDPENPFGALIKEGVHDPMDPTSSKKGGQYYYIDEKGNKQLGLINKTRAEGDWNDWKDTLSSQFLAKQPLSLAKRQLTATIAERKSELDEIKSLTNPTVKKVLLDKYALQADSDAVHLQAAALPRQKYQVILPITSMKDNEVYAPNYRDGETVALVRFPHAGQFEIPILKVNNKQPEGREVLGKNPFDAIGINSKVAERLSGADFDGDTVLVIPTNNKVRVKNQPPLKGLEGFDPKIEYPYREGMKLLKKTQKGNEMGKVSNLITDMQIKGAPPEDIAKAVRHSMVVIDAEKHKLDYKRSEDENGIAGLKRKYQGHYEDDGRYHEGVSTIISRAKSETQIPKRKGSGIVDPKTGEVTYKLANENYIQAYNPKTKKWVSAYENKDGSIVYKDGKNYIPLENGMKTRIVERTQKSTRMADTPDARTLLSDKDHPHPMEVLYADYANEQKRLAKEARKAMYDSDGKQIRLKYDPSARAAYSKEVSSLDNKLNLALRNKPKERQAQAIANAYLKKMKEAYPELETDKKATKKIGHQALVKARLQVGAERKPIEITDNEWKAIQAGAISDNKLKQILEHTDIDKLRERAMPRKTGLTSTQQSRIKALKSAGLTNAEIATAMHISASTVSKYS